LAKKPQKTTKETPLMQQYLGIKNKYPDAVLLFRVGDFYETFGKDAIKASKILDITLTKRANGSASHIELAGFPHHALDTYLPKLVRAGQRVAICDQLEDPKTTKTIVKRGVTELVTPGVSYNDKTLEGKSNNFLAAVTLKKDKSGVAFLDVSTGEFMVAEGSHAYVSKLLQSFQPNEILFEKGEQLNFKLHFGDNWFTYKLEDWVFNLDFAQELLLKQFDAASLKGFGIEEMDLAVIAAGAALHYLADTQHHKIKHIVQVSRIHENNHVWMDRFTMRNLELLHSPHEKAVTLLDIIDQTASPMGSRMIKRWLAMPLRDRKHIEERHDAVAFFQNHGDSTIELVSLFQRIGDLDRLISKVATGRINPREVRQLKNALECLAPIKEMCASSKEKALVKLGERIVLCETIQEQIDKSLVEEPPIQLGKGAVVAEGIHTELDELRAISNDGQKYLANLRERESAATGITSLKIGFNNVFGYFLEVRNTFKDKVPEEWIRKQTLVSAERYITEELKEYESKILGAEEKINAIEGKLYNDLVQELMDYIDPILVDANVVAQLDCLSSFAQTANANNYVRPELNDDFGMQIKDGRHPVIEKQLPPGEVYVPNDIELNRDDQQIIMITGPNMAGKSALLRQVALISIMAQMGSFVPASEAKIGIVDKVFTRVGASDNISSGESTFMVEMTETASILNNLSERSLILLDEIGRGTSTYDGISIAWSIAEYLHSHPSKAKTLFATHYHELNEMTHQFDRIKNFNVSVKESGKKIIFMRKLVPGGSEHSFGIHVAKMAGMPNLVVSKANKILKKLEQNNENLDASKRESLKDDDMQLSFFKLDDPILEEIREEIMNLDINTLTPVEALMKLNEIKKLVGNKG
jgi:DNA mismatch repair protein MutS